MARPLTLTLRHKTEGIAGAGVTSDKGGLSRGGQQQEVRHSTVIPANNPGL